MRERISAAALLVKVTARMAWGEVFSTSISQAIRCTSTLVLPLPAPATTSAFPSGAETASRWAWLRPSKMCVMSKIKKTAPVAQARQSTVDRQV